MTEVLESPDVLDDSEPLTAEKHISWDLPTACRNVIVVESCMKLQVEVPANVLEVWIWSLLAD